MPLPRFFSNRTEQEAFLSNPSPNEVPHLLVHEQADNVGVVLVEGLATGTDMLCCITQNHSTFRLTAKHDVPIRHKIALNDLK